MKRGVLAFLFVLFLIPCNAQDQKAKEYLFRMINAIDQVTHAQYNLLLHERIGSHFRNSEFEVKLSVRPFKLYALSRYPNPGAEALLVDGANNQKALINPNRFPYINISLSPHSNLLRKNHHFTLYDIGFSYVRRLLKGYIQRDSVGFFKILRFYPNIDYQGSSYYMLEMNYTDYATVDYLVQKDENLSSIADKLLVNDYKILSLNPDLSGYDDVRPGQQIKVPSAFARRIVLYLDKVTLLPLVQTVYDDKGLYGRYEMRNFILNPVFEKAEFTTTYSGYRF